MNLLGDDVDDPAAKSVRSSRRGGAGEGKVKKYQVHVELRTSSEYILHMIRNDIEALIADLTHGQFIIS